MKATELKSEGLKKEYTVVIPAADFEKQVEAKISQIAKSTKIPGFRPGKAPKEMLKQKYRASVLGEVLDEAVRDATEEVIKSNKLNPVMMPNIKVTKFEDGKDIEFSLNIELMPEIKVGDLSSIKLEKLMAEVPAEEVEKALNYIAQSRRETVKVEEDRAAAKGDTVVIDFVGSVDGVEFQGGKGNNYPLELGSNSFIPGFEDQLIGKKAGEKVDVNVTFPENYHAKDLAGKASVFAVEIKELRTAKAVEINDEFAKSLGEESLDKLKAAIAERIKGDYEAASKMKLKRQLLDNLDSEYSFDVPAGLVDAEYKSIVDQYEQAKKFNQLDESEKAKSEEELLAEYKDIAVRRVKLGLLLSEIGKNAKVTITPDDINKAIMNEAKKYPGQEKAVFDYYLKNKQAIEALKAPVFEEKIVDYVIGKSNVSEKIVSIEELYSFDDDKKPAKKSAKKSAEKAETKETKKSSKKSA
ncbi:MAG: trigger factor [Alphaproteobacteria bacterium]|nr:trigger factor [Alphaproteobacteria bacterium]